MQEPIEGNNMTQKPTPEDMERQNLLAKINELEQILNNERTVGRQKWQKELANDAFNHFKGQEILNEMFNTNEKNLPPY